MTTTPARPAPTLTLDSGPGDFPGIEKRRVIVIPADIYIRHKLEQHHRAALLSGTPPVPAWQRREAPPETVAAARRRGRRRRLFRLLFSPAHGRV
jgi:hypothetical protein